MKGRAAAVFSFPDQVNESAARVVAGGVVVMAILAIALGLPWMLVPLTYGFWARVLTGPTLSPLGQLATRVVVPVVHLPWRPTPGPPKRFAQGIGAALTTMAVLTWAFAGWELAALLVGLLALAAFLEAAFGLCLGCRIFAVLMRIGLVPESVCEDCRDLSARPRPLSAAQPGTDG